MSATSSALVLYDSEHVALTHHQVFLVTVLQLCSGIFAIEHGVALLQNHRIVFSFSLAVSGMMIPPTFSSAGAGSTSTLSANGLIVIIAMFIYCLTFNIGCCVSATHLYDCQNRANRVGERMVTNVSRRDVTACRTLCCVCYI